MIAINRKVKTNRAATSKPPPLRFGFPVMEAQLVKDIPVGGEWLYEPKWDGFRCLAFRDGDSVRLQSKSGQDLTRYFPEVVDMFRGLKAKKFIIDGEIIIINAEGEVSFDAMLMRIHPAASRVKKLAGETPATCVVFDLLRDQKHDSLIDEPLEQRRKLLEAFAKSHFAKQEHLKLSPATRDIDQARKWFRAQAGTDGIVAKDLTLPYQFGERSGMQKVKRIRTADCVVGGFRYGSKSRQIGSLLLGLFDDDGLLHHVGYTSGIKASERAALTKKMEKLRKSAERGGGFSGRAPGGPSRWSTERSGEWESVDPKLVVEVQFDHFSGGRFRHGTKFLRWRPDKKPSQCTMEQVKSVGRALPF